jgi:hypothetical protein
MHWILCHFPSAPNHTQINTIYIQGKPLYITNSHIRKLFWTTYATFGSKATLGFDAHEIGNSSIWPGPAMALFLQDVSTAKIMILGQWSHDAFLVCIWPQVLEWTKDPCLQKCLCPFNGSSSILVP